jgi:hypothetical protein
MTSIDSGGFREFEFPRKTSEVPSIDQILASIPKYCFQISTATSIRYFVQDVLIVSSLYGILFYYQEIFDRFPILYLFMWFSIGTMFWALFVVGTIALLLNSFFLFASFTLRSRLWTSIIF